MLWAGTNRLLLKLLYPTTTTWYIVPLGTALWRADNVNHLQKYNDNGLAECAVLQEYNYSICMSYLQCNYTERTRIILRSSFFLGYTSKTAVHPVSQSISISWSSIQSPYLTIPMFSSLLSPWLSSWWLRAYPMPYSANSCDHRFCARVYRLIYVCVHICLYLLSLAHCLPSFLLVDIYFSDFVHVYQIVSLHVCYLCLPRCQLPGCISMSSFMPTVFFHPQFISLSTFISTTDTYINFLPCLPPCSAAKLSLCLPLSY